MKKTRKTFKLPACDGLTTMKNMAIYFAHRLISQSKLPNNGIYFDAATGFSFCLHIDKLITMNACYRRPEHTLTNCCSLSLSPALIYLYPFNSLASLTSLYLSICMSISLLFVVNLFRNFEPFNRLGSL